MANSNRPPGPAWLRHPVAGFFASLKLAVVLLAVLIIAAITGTIYESSFDAKVARAYVYGAPWFNIWLTLLAANLAVSALSRWPWRKHHVAFLVTHLGIITLLAGSLIGRIFGTEGSITLFKGDSPTNRLLIDERQLRIHDSDGIIKGYPAEFIHHPPRPDKPRNLGSLANGARLSIVDYAPALEARLNPRPVTTGGAPALHFSITTAMMNQRLESWLLTDSPEHARFSMGLANIELKRGSAPAPSGEKSAPSAAAEKTATDLEEAIFAFSKAPDEQIGRVIKGGATGVKIKLENPTGGNKGRVLVSLGGKEFDFDVAQFLGRDTPIGDSAMSLRIDDYWPDFRIDEGKPGSISDQPNNPAVLVTVHGKGIAAAPQPEKSHGAEKEMSTTGGPPTMPAEGEAAPNHLTLFVAGDGAITYELVSRKNGTSSGKLDLNQPLATGWADWQLVVDKFLPQADHWMEFNPVKADPTAPIKEMPDGIRVQLDQNGEKMEQWVPAGWQIRMPTKPNPVMVAYGFRQLPLPIGLELLDFEVKRNEGNDSPAGFKSTLKISTPDGNSAVGSCWMNNPFSYPTDWWRPWTGLTYKISQASWNPENLNQSTVQILRDPGWSLKWIGSLLVVAGVFMMFYLRPYRRQTVGEPITASPSKKAEPARSESLEPAVH
ncbi:MAG TPA: hypothetical protein VJ719_16040 [Chthoniobacterales bacterium]|nr:hypothetical protein [Chthoniobacterales bacterium]